MDFFQTYSVSGTPTEIPWWSRKANVRGISVEIAGLCSSWMAEGEDQGKLLIGQYQIDRVLPISSNADIRITILHHPLSYLPDFDYGPVRSSIYRRSDLLLRGHLHELTPETVIQSDGACTEIAAGAVYEGRSKPNSFHYLEVDLEHKQVRVYPYIWLQKLERWIIDRNNFGADGVAILPLGRNPNLNTTVSKITGSKWYPTLGQQIPQRQGWILIAKLGEGGCGEVWLAEKEFEKRAFKFCTDAAKARFLRRELGMYQWMRDNSRNRIDIIKVYDWDLDSWPPYLEMEYCEKGNLSSWIERNESFVSRSLSFRVRAMLNIANAVRSYSQELCMEKLGGDPFFFYSIHKLYSFYYLRQAFGMM